MLNRLIFIEKKLLKLEESTVILFLSLIVTFQITQVFFRYVLNNPLAWIDESSRYLFLWMIMIGSAVGVQWLAHFSVPVLVEKFPRYLKVINKVFTTIIPIGFIVILIVYGFTFTESFRGNVTPAMNLPVAVPYLAIPIGSILIFIHLILNMIKEIAGDKIENKNNNFV